MSIYSSYSVGPRVTFYLSKSKCTENGCHQQSHAIRDPAAAIKNGTPGLYETVTRCILPNFACGEPLMGGFPLVSKVTVDDIFVRLQGVGLLKLQCGLCGLYSSKCLLRVWALRIYSSYSAGTVLCTHSECRVGTLTVCAVALGTWLVTGALSLFVLST